MFSGQFCLRQQIHHVHYLFEFLPRKHWQWNQNSLAPKKVIWELVRTYKFIKHSCTRKTFYICCKLKLSQCFTELLLLHCTFVNNMRLYFQVVIVSRNSRQTKSKPSNMEHQFKKSEGEMSAFFLLWVPKNFLSQKREKKKQTIKTPSTNRTTHRKANLPSIFKPHK